MVSYLVLHLRLYLGHVSLACLRDSPVATSSAELSAMVLTSVVPSPEGLRLL